MDCLEVGGWRAIFGRGGWADSIVILHQKRLIILFVLFFLFILFLDVIQYSVEAISDVVSSRIKSTNLLRLY